MKTYARYEVEVVPPSAIRRGDTLLYLRRGRAFELRVRSNPVRISDFAKEVKVYWPGEDVERGIALSRGETCLRLVES